MFIIAIRQIQEGKLCKTKQPAEAGKNAMEPNPAFHPLQVTSPFIWLISAFPLISIKKTYSY